MLRLDKNDKNYTLVEYKDILIGLNYASKTDDEKINNLLKDLFVDLETEDIHIGEKRYKKLQTDSEIVKYLKEEVKIIDYDNFVNHNILKDALVRAYYEFNHKMKNELSRYFRIYVDNEIKGIDNEIIKNEIINDKNLLKYIKEYDTFDEYIEKKININIGVEKNIKSKGKHKSKVG